MAQTENQQADDRKPKKTNYRRLWRDSKAREMKLYNFSKEVITAVQKHFTNKDELTAFMKYVDYLKSTTFQQ